MGIPDHMVRAPIDGFRFMPTASRCPPVNASKARSLRGEVRQAREDQHGQ